MRSTRRAVLAAIVVLVAAGRPAVAQQREASSADRDSLRKAIDLLRREVRNPILPVLGEVTRGDLTIPAGSRAKGTVAIAHGQLDIYGDVDGDVAVYGGNVVLHPGSSVQGNIFAVRGKVMADSGQVGGAIRILHGRLAEVAPRSEALPLSPAAATRRALSLTLGSFALVFLIGIGVFVFAGSYLEGVVDELEDHFWRSLWVGLVGQVALIPALLLLCLALTITILGILLIPFAVVAVVLAAVGVVTLGFLAAAQVTGYSVLRVKDRPLSQRGLALRALVTGVVIYLAVWMLAAQFTWASPAVSIALRAVALVLTWVAATVGFGAALTSRGGTLREEAPAKPRERIVTEEIDWQTPTPVTGVVAARRPTPFAGSKK